MTAKIKLNAASGGGSFSLQAPSSSANNRVMTLPDTADGTILTTTNPKAGNIIQVVSTTKTDAFTTNAAAASPAAITGLSVSITPSSTSNKIFLTTHIGHTTTSNDNYASFFYFYRGGSVISGAIGDANSSNRRVAFYQRGSFKYHGTAASMIYLDSPSSTSALTYQIYASVEGSGGYTQVNRSGSTDTTNAMGRTISTLTAMEVAA
jgi:hypothetical protein